jgi:hypothetical protein
MNERIQALAEQAGFYVADGKIYIPSTSEEITTCQKNFAELLLKECMTMSDELKAQYLTSRKSTMDFDEKNIYAEGEAACDVLKYKMKKHFGVES